MLTKYLFKTKCLAKKEWVNVLSGKADTDGGLIYSAKNIHGKLMPNKIGLAQKNTLLRLCLK